MAAMAVSKSSSEKEEEDFDVDVDLGVREPREGHSKVESERFFVFFSTPPFLEDATLTRDMAIRRNRNFIL